MNKLSNKNKIILLLVFGLAVFGLAEFLGLRARFNLQAIRSVFEQNLLWSILLFIMLFSLGNLLYIPGLVFLGAAVLSLGKYVGGLTTFLAALVSCCVSYFLVDLIGRNSLREFENKKIAQKIFTNMDKHPLISIILLRFIFQTSPALNYALPMAGIKFSYYFLGTLIGLPIPIIMYCIFFETVFKNIN